MFHRSKSVLPVVLLALCAVVTYARANQLTATITIGVSPTAAAVNPVTNKIYVTHAGGTVTVIDGATTITSGVSTGFSPGAVAVNAVTNKIYVANSISIDTLTAIDGAPDYKESIT